ncbi:DoxX family protein [Thalassococcus sp. BH17M4-6]|uniref:DoxX family protein n=1 Tax=Thalassococcus sp. BH17M4-6 TaxID=3413148 RepID=UPI003BC7CFAD
MTTRIDDTALLIARALIAALFVAGAVQKAVDPGAAQGLLAGLGLPQVLVWPALVFNALAALALLIGVAVRPVAFALAGYCAATSFFHLIPSDPWQMSIFVKNWAIAGGCLALAVAGAGRYVVTRQRKL